MRIPERDVLPMVIAQDPAAHDEHFFPNHPTRQDFLEQVTAFLSGSVAYSTALETQAQALRLDGPLGPLGVVPTLPVPVSDEMLADLAEDYNPDLGVMGERLTGDPFEKLSVPLAGAFFFVPTIGGGVRAVELWAEECRNAPLKEAVRRVDRAGPWLWAGERPLLWGEEGPAMVGRRVLDPKEHLLGAMEVKGKLEPVYRRLRAELWRYRLWKTGAGMAEMLRKRPELLYRSVAEVR